MEWPETQAELKERLLRAYFTEGADIADPAERMARFGHPFHFRIYGRDLVARLTAAGFRVETVWSKRLLNAHARRRFRINNNFLFHCRRA